MESCENKVYLSEIYDEEPATNLNMDDFVQDQLLSPKELVKNFICSIC